MKRMIGLAATIITLVGLMTGCGSGAKEDASFPQKKTVEIELKARSISIDLYYLNESNHLTTLL